MCRTRDIMDAACCYLQLLPEQILVEIVNEHPSSVLVDVAALPKNRAPSAPPVLRHHVSSTLNAIVVSIKSF